ncbi:MAG TPA: hypothetical protein VIM77_13430 [Mucilaginibacter sp.]
MPEPLQLIKIILQRHMFNDYFTLNTIVELICLIFALMCVAKDKDLAWRLMAILMIVTFASETAGRYVFLHSASKNNHWVYNISILFEIAIIHIMFAHLFKRYINFKLALIISITVLGLCYAFDMYNKGFFWYSNHTYTLMSVLFVLYSLIYYYLRFRDEEYIDLRTSPGFWWTTGVLFFFFGATACNLFDEELYAVMFYDHHLTYYIFRLLNFILYGFWTYSFICRKWFAAT